MFTLNAFSTDYELVKLILVEACVEDILLKITKNFNKCSKLFTVYLLFLVKENLYPQLHMNSLY